MFSVKHKTNWLVNPFHPWPKLLCVGLSGFLLACSSPSSAIAPSSQAQRPLNTQPMRNPAQQDLGQQLPISAQVKIKGQVIQLEVAQTVQQKATGLMYRTALAANRGMLFTFEPPRSIGFWMKNTLIPLDMVFLRNGKIQTIKAQVPPCKADPCPSYGPGPNTLIDQVIELRGGRAAELGLKAGDRITIQFLPKNTRSNSQS